MNNFEKGAVISFILGALVGLGVVCIADNIAHTAATKKQHLKDEIEFAIVDSEHYNEFDIIYVKSTDTGWEVSTEDYGTLFVEMHYNEAITMASVLSWIGYQCDYYCKEEMVERALYEHNQLMNHD